MSAESEGVGCRRIEDRLASRLDDGGELVVDLPLRLRADQDPATWSAAQLTL